MMKLQEQIELWNETDQYEAIIEAIEALPEAEQTPELISELARAYNNTAGLDDTQNYEKAIALLKSVEEDLGEEHSWNFRIAYAYYYLDQEGPALTYFERALDARPKDEDTLAFKMPYFDMDYLEKHVRPEFDEISEIIPISPEDYQKSIKYEDVCTSARN